MEQCLYSWHGPILLLSPSLLIMSFFMILLWPKLNYSIVFAWQCTLNKSCRLSNVEQTLFKGHELISCLTWSNRAHKNQLNVVLKLKNLPKSKADFQFPCCYLWWFLVSKPLGIRKNSSKHFCSTHVALQSGEDGLPKFITVWEIQGFENHVWDGLHRT